MLKFINPFAQPTLVVAGVSASGCSWRCRDSNGCSDGLGFLTGRAANGALSASGGLCRPGFPLNRLEDCSCAKK